MNTLNYGYAINDSPSQRGGIATLRHNFVPHCILFSGDPMGEWRGFAGSNPRCCTSYRAKVGFPNLRIGRVDKGKGGLRLVAISNGGSQC